MKRGDVLFFGSRTWISSLIRWTLKSRYSHVAVALSDDLVFEADWDGVHTHKMTKYPQSLFWHKAVTVFDSKEDIEDFIKGLLSEEGKPYDYLQVVNLVFNRIFHISRCNDVLLNSANRFICSELISKHLIRKGFSFKLPLAQINPEDLETHLDLFLEEKRNAKKP